MKEPYNQNSERYGIVYMGLNIMALHIGFE